MATSLNLLPQFPVMPTVIQNGFKWSRTAAGNASKLGGYVRVGGQSATRRFLSGARKSWASTDPNENRTIFLPDYRISGTPENVRTALQYAQEDPAQIENSIRNAITRENVDGAMRGLYDAEIQATCDIKRQRQSGNNKEVYGLDVVEYLGRRDVLKGADIVTKTGESKGPARSPGRAGPTKSLATKLRELPSDKVLDVSNMDMATGKGVRTITKPKSPKTGKHGASGVPIVSNNLERYVEAIRLAYGPEGVNTYAPQIAMVRESLARSGAPILMNRLSPQRGATLAPAPVFTRAATTTLPPISSPRLGGGVSTLGGGSLPLLPPLGGTFRQ